MANLIDSLTDYRLAIATARREHKLSMPRAIRSVLTAKLRYGIGPRFHSLFELATHPESAWPDFLLDEPLKVVLRRMNPEQHREVVNDKLLFMNHCMAHGIATIPLVCAVDRHPRTACPPALLAKDQSDWCRLIDAGPNEQFVKLINGSWGLDAFLIERRGGQWHYCGQSGDSAALYAFAMERLGQRRGWIVQPRIRPHPALQAIMSPHGLGTFRVVSVLDNDTPRILYAVLRIPVGMNRADNFVHGSSGNLIAAVDLAAGQLSRARASKSPSWPVMIDVDLHPETGGTITGMTIPQWSELKELVIQSHSTLPDLVTLGWDIALTDDGPLVVETNPTYDIDIIQTALKQGVGREMGAYLVKPLH